MKLPRPFLATFVNKLDAKGRVSVPAKFRDVLDTQGSRTIYARASTSGPAIVVGGPAWMEKLHELVEDHDPTGEVHDDFAYTLLGDTVELSLDSEGRVAFPDDLLRHAGLSENAAFVGLGSYFEVWEPQALEERKMQARRATKERRGHLRANGNGGIKP
jgi:MraZ protein